MPSIDTFDTKRGVARFTDDAVCFEESVVRNVRSLYRGYWRGDRLRHKAVFVGYVVAVCWAVGWTLFELWRGRLALLATVYGIVALVLLVDFARGFRSTDRIPLDDVERVSATRGERGFTRPRLVIAYSDDGSTRKRRVNLPSLGTDDGAAAFDLAREAFEERGFEVA